MSFPIDQLAPDVAALFKHLECPVCLDVKADTLTICKSGHVCCSGCFRAMNGNRCPTCREFVIGPVPCQPINSLAQALGIVPEPPAPRPQAAASEDPGLRLRVPVPPRRQRANPRGLPPHLAQSAIVKRARNQVTFYLRRFNLIKRDVLSNRDQLRIGELGRDLNKTLEAIGTKLRAFVTVTGGYPFPGRMPEDCGYDAFGQGDHYGGDADNRWMERVLAM